MHEHHTWKRNTLPVITGSLWKDEEFLILETFLGKTNNFYIRIMVVGKGTTGWIYVDSKNYEKHFDLVWA
jgi:hypothetical protein